MAAGFKTATVNASDVAATLTDYPTYVDLSRLGITTLAEAESVRVYADEAKTTEWAREIVSVSEMHVKVPSLTTTTDIYVDWDGVASDYAVTATYGAQAVWADYWAVWHMEGANGTTAKKLDSTGNGHNLVENNTIPTEVAGKLGSSTSGAYDMSGLAGQTSNSSSYSYLTSDNLHADIGSLPYTISTWFNPDITNTVSWRLVAQENNDGDGRPFTTLDRGATTFETNFTFEPHATSGANDSGFTTGVMATGSWSYATGRRTATNFYSSVCLNGEIVTNSTTDSASYATANSVLNISRRYNSSYSSARRYCDGQFDEVRVRLSDEGDNWQTTEYNNQNDETTFWGTWADAGSTDYTFAITVEADTFTGQAITLSYGKTITLTAETTTFTGNEITLLAGETFAIEVGASTFTGNNITFSKAISVPVEVETTTFTGIAITIQKEISIPLEVETVVFTGNNIQFRTPTVWTERTKNTSVWTRRNQS